MSQILSQVLGQHMRLEQRLTPQLIQSMEILQLNTADLENRIAEELEKNVTLELADEQPPPDAQQTPSVPNDGGTAVAEAASFSRLARFSRENELEYDDRSPNRPRPRPTADDRDAKFFAMANTPNRPTSLDEHLLEQWHLLDLDIGTRRAGEAIIYHLEEDGYLKTRLEEIEAPTKPALSVETLERALTLVQKLDPVGIAARDYQECLLLQLDTLPGDNTIERVLIQKHLEDIAQNRYPAIATATGYDVGEITEAVEVIKQRLVLHPAFVAVDRRAPRIYPDVIIEEDERGKGLVVRLARGNLPELRIKKEYVDMLKASRNGAQVHEFLRKQVHGASSLIEAVKFRRSRLMDVSRAIVEHQSEFFDVGPAGLKVLRMSDVGMQLGCDPSTISRTVADKYVQTPRGIYPMRYFFTGGTDTGRGAGASWDSIRMRVAELVKDEDLKNPFNDDQLAALLAKENIHISRRTVAKYRAQLEIPAARQRRRF